jgi:hypothetical protein
MLPCPVSPLLLICGIAGLAILHQALLNQSSGPINWHVHLVAPLYFVIHVFVLRFISCLIIILLM